MVTDDKLDEIPLQPLHPLLLVNKRLVVMEIKVADLQTIFQRALNTWADCPSYILALSDKLEKL